MTTQTDTRHVGKARLQLARAITLVGLVAGVFSLLQTIGHISDPAYLIPGLEDGSGHVHYHLARETMMTLGGFAVIVLGLFAPPRSRMGLLWWVMMILGLAYVAAMWSGSAVTDEAAPSGAALIVHTISSLGLVIGIVLAKPAYRTDWSGLAQP